MNLVKSSTRSSFTTRDGITIRAALTVLVTLLSLLVWQACVNPSSADSSGSAYSVGLAVADVSKAIADRDLPDGGITAPGVVVSTVAATPATLETANGQLDLGVPSARAGTLTREGVVFDTPGNGASVVVQATSTGGLRALIHIGSPGAPTRYAVPLGGEVRGVKLRRDGGATALDSHGTPVAYVAAPWATDANGRAVPTHYEVKGATLYQVVEHTSADFEYGVVADPSVFSCDLGLSTCVKLSKSETEAAWMKYASVGVAGAVTYLCTKIPFIPAAAVCVGALAAYGSAMRGTFKSAAAEGKCVELHFALGAVAPWKWKKEKC